MYSCVCVCVCVGGSEEHRALHHGRSIHVRALDSQNIQSTQKVGIVLSCGVVCFGVCGVISSVKKSFRGRLLSELLLHAMPHHIMTRCCMR